MFNVRPQLDYACRVGQSKRAENSAGPAPWLIYSLL
jgi:hypothetical protein